MTTPYYQDDHVTLYHGDCLTEHREWLEADVLVTDPPYGANWYGWKTNDLLVKGDHSTAARDRSLELFDPEKPQLVFGKWSVERPDNVKALLTWEKGNHTGVGDLNIPWRPSTEEIYVRGTWPKRPSLGRGGGGRVSPVYRINATSALTEAQGRLHPTEKPPALMEALIEKCPPGVIADPFAGSGSTLVAARNLGRHAIGVELEEKYCEIIAKRLAQDVLPLGI